MGRLLKWIGALSLLAAGCGPLKLADLASVSTEPGQVSVREVSVSVGGASLAARIAAPVDPAASLIALHGGPGVASSYMRGLERLTADGVAVISYDQRGVAGSGLPSAAYSMSANVEDLAAVQRELAPASTVLFGHSWGGLLALNYAAEHPERVRALILFGSAPPTRSALDAAARELDARLRLLQERGIVPRPLPADMGYLQAIQPVYFSDPTAPLPPELIGLDYSPRVNRATWATLGAFDYRERFSAIDQRVLFYWGADDPFGDGMAEATLQALANARVEVVWLEDCGHYWYECPGPFYERMVGFLANLY